MGLRRKPYGKFKEKRQQWLQQLFGQDRHSVVNQISRMIWDAAAFRIINEARRYAENADDGGVKLNGMVHQLVNRGFLASQASAIRRLIDKAPATGHREVCSLYGLLDDMEQNGHLMTREHILAIEGKAYDYEPIRKAYMTWCQQQEQAGKETYWVPEHLVWQRHEERHQQIYKLCGVTRSNTAPDDSACPDCLVCLKKELHVCDNVKTYVDKFIAHAASPDSRAIVNADDVSITFGELWSAHKAICKVANFVSIYFLGQSEQGFLPVPQQYDQFKYIDRPLVAAENVPRLRETWNKYAEETQSWGAWDWGQSEATDPLQEDE